ncbi:MAG: Fic family protein [Gemmataceae bacterium]|nr:Fic family protein [Gemmataceae bacterium]MDW8244071.1 Fic family protein [Thermogemmata sp.]
MRELHARLMEGVRGERATPGEFRRSQNWIGPPECTLNDAIFVAPPVQEMQQALHAFERYLHAQDEYPPLIRLAFVHYQFEAIHPFLDGNRRSGRLLISLLLVSWRLLPLPLLYLSAFFEKYRDSYYQLLLKVSEQGAWQEWVNFFLQGVTSQLRDGIARAKCMQNLQAEWRQKVTTRRASSLLLRLVDPLFESPILSITQAQRALEVTYRSALRIINRLVERDILQRMPSQAYGKTSVA